MAFTLSDIAEKYGIILKGTLYGCLKSHSCNDEKEKKYSLNEISEVLKGEKKFERPSLERRTVYRRHLFKKPDF